jgi:hypothetical protein
MAARDVSRVLVPGSHQSRMATTFNGEHDTIKSSRPEQARCMTMAKRKSKPRMPSALCIETMIDLQVLLDDLKANGDQLEPILTQDLPFQTEVCRGLRISVRRCSLDSRYRLDYSELEAAIEGLPAVHARLQRVAILNRPALGVIEGQDGPQTLHSLDPPYAGETRTARKVYAYEMTRADHIELLDTLQQIRGKVLLSGYRSEMYDTALSDWNRRDIDVANHAAGGKLLWREADLLRLIEQPA